MAAGAPAHQPGPGQRRGQREDEGHGGEMRHEAGRQLGDVGGRLGRHAGLHRHPDHPDDDGQPVKNSSVNQSISAATLRRRVGSANAASVARAGSAEQQRAFGEVGGPGRQQRHQGEPQRQRHVARRRAAAPAPEGPQRQRPGRPGEPQQQLGLVAPVGDQAHVRVAAGQVDAAIGRGRARRRARRPAASCRARRQWPRGCSVGSGSGHVVGLLRRRSATSTAALPRPSTRATVGPPDSARPRLPTASATRRRCGGRAAPRRRRTGRRRRTAGPAPAWFHGPVAPGPGGDQRQQGAVGDGRA